MMSNSASDKKWNVGRQKAQATIGEAFRLMTVNGVVGANYCKNLGGNHDWTLPEIREASLMFLNLYLIKGQTNMGTSFYIYASKAGQDTVFSKLSTTGATTPGVLIGTPDKVWGQLSSSSCGNKMCYARCVRANALK